MTTESLVGVEEAAKLAGLKRDSIYHYIYQRGLPVARRTGRGHLLFSPAAMRKWRADFERTPPSHTISEANKKKMADARRKSQEAKRRAKWNETMAVAVGVAPSANGDGLSEWVRAELRTAIREEVRRIMQEAVK